MNNITLKLIHPLILGKIKLYQNLSLIILCIVLLLAFTLSWFEIKILNYVVGYLLGLSILLIILFILLSLPFLFFKRLEIVKITNGLLSITIDNKPIEFNIDNLRFLLNIEDEILENKRHLNSEIIKGLSTWGNYVVITSKNSHREIYIQFIPDEDFLELLPQLNIETYKSRSILMNDTTDLIKKFMWMLWGAS